MVPPATQLRVREARRQRQEQERNRRRFAVVAAFSLVAVVTGAARSFRRLRRNSFRRPGARKRVAAPAGRPAAARDHREHRGAPHPAAGRPVARHRARLPGRQRRRARALARRHPGEPGAAAAARARRSSAARAAAPRWYQLPGGEGPATSSIDVGAAPGTDVYSPVDGTVVAIDDVVLNGSTLGSQVDIQPTVAPSLVVSVSHISVDTGLDGRLGRHVGRLAARRRARLLARRAAGARALHERRR